MKKTVRIMVSVAFIACCIGELSAQTLIVGAPEWRPYHIVDGEVLTGITPDIIQELARRTGYTMNVETLPHKRMMHKFKIQQIDLEPMVNPAWRKDQQNISVYTTTIYTTRDVIFVRKGSGIKGTSVQDFKGLSLGCGLGYYYPEGFQEAFENGEILREDNRIAKNNLIKLLLKRLDGVIIDKIQANYLIKTFNIDRDNFQIAYQFRPSKLSYRLHIAKKDLLSTLNSAIESMKAAGTIEQIVMKYTQ